MKTFRLSHLLLTAVALSACITSIAASAQTDETTVRHVAGRIPVQGFGREMSADRPTDANGQPARSSVSPKANPWKLQATLPGAVIHDISFPTTLVGYAAAELGQVWKTTNGGSKWTEIMNLVFPACTSAAMAARPGRLMRTPARKMDACDSEPVGTKFQVWWSGYNSLFVGLVYTPKGIGAE